MGCIVMGHLCSDGTGTFFSGRAKKYIFILSRSRVSIAASTTPRKIFSLIARLVGEFIVNIYFGTCGTHNLFHTFSLCRFDARDLCLVVVVATGTEILAR